MSVSVCVSVYIYLHEGVGHYTYSDIFPQRVWQASYIGRRVTVSAVVMAADERNLGKKMWDGNVVWKLLSECFMFLILHYYFILMLTLLLRVDLRDQIDMSSSLIGTVSHYDSFRPAGTGGKRALWMNAPNSFSPISSLTVSVAHKLD